MLLKQTISILLEFLEAKLPYISFLTDPTTDTLDFAIDDMQGYIDQEESRMVKKQE